MPLSLASRADLTLANYRRVAWQGETACFAPEALARMRASRRQFLDLLDSDPELTIYGVTSGYGQHANKRLVGEERKARLKANLLGLMLHHPGSVDEPALHLLVANARNTRWVQVDLVLPDRLAAILPQVPAQVDAIWGEFDRPHPDPALQEAVIRRSHPDCDFRVIADAGHWAMYERPEAFDAALLDMLRQPLRRPS